MNSATSVPRISRPTAAPAAWAEDMFTVGVTGTNGKTSTTLLVAEVFRAAGRGVTVETTLGVGNASGEHLPRVDGAFVERMRQARESGICTAAIEVTSEALARNWAKRWRFDLGVFTNLSQDHLNAHKTFEHYLASKAQLFVHLAPGAFAVLNASDPATELLDQVIPVDVQRFFTASPTRGPAFRPAQLTLESFRIDLEGTELVLAPSVATEHLGRTLRTRLIGSVFAENALAAAAVGLCTDIPVEAIRRGLLGLDRVPGRFEIVARSPVVAVDYAHTPDALARTCDAARELARNLGDGRVIIVFGAGGNRDTQKRRPMGEAVGGRADYAIVTSDNPRDENPRDIARPIESGCRHKGRAHVWVELDRRAAIVRAVETARPNDVIVVCGKGHETGQTIKQETLPFDDAAVVRELLGGDG